LAIGIVIRVNDAAGGVEVGESALIRAIHSTLRTHPPPITQTYLLHRTPTTRGKSRWNMTVKCTSDDNFPDSGFLFDCGGCNPSQWASQSSAILGPCPNLRSATPSVCSNLARDFPAFHLSSSKRRCRGRAWHPFQSCPWKLVSHQPPQTSRFFLLVNPLCYCSQCWWDVWR